MPQAGPSGPAEGAATGDTAPWSTAPNATSPPANQPSQAQAKTDGWSASNPFTWGATAPAVNQGSQAQAKTDGWSASNPVTWGATAPAANQGSQAQAETHRSDGSPPNPFAGWPLQSATAPAANLPSQAQAETQRSDDNPFQSFCEPPAGLPLTVPPARAGAEEPRPDVSKAEKPASAADPFYTTALPNPTAEKKPGPTAEMPAPANDDNTTAARSSVNQTPQALGF
jgi:hypothetical protein